MYCEVVVRTLAEPGGDVAGDIFAPDKMSLFVSLQAGKTLLDLLLNIVVILNFMFYSRRSSSIPLN